MRTASSRLLAISPHSSKRKKLNPRPCVDDFPSLRNTQWCLTCLLHTPKDLTEEQSKTVTTAPWKTTSRQLLSPPWALQCILQFSPSPDLEQPTLTSLLRGSGNKTAHHSAVPSSLKHLPIRSMLYHVYNFSYFLRCTSSEPKLSIPFSTRTSWTRLACLV